MGASPLRRAFALALVAAAAAFLLVPAAQAAVALEYETYYMADRDTEPEQNYCLGEDDRMEWRASGTLAPGESYTFSPQRFSCTWNVWVPRTVRGVYGFGAPVGGQNVSVSVVAICDPLWQFPCDPHSDFSVPHRDSGDWIGYWCMETRTPSGTSAGTNDWQLTITNGGSKTAKNVVLSGADLFPGYTCAGWPN